MTVRKVAMIGVGQMGAPMARNILRAGFELIICDRNEAAIAPFRDLGVQCVDSAADCAGCDVVVVLVATPEQTKTVLLGPGGLLEGVAENVPVVAVMGTIAPREMLDLAEELQRKAIPIVDAPISGGAVGAIDGSLAIMVGGQRDVFDRLLPLMESMGRSIFHCGSLGTGQATKIVNNIVGISTQMVAGEAYRILLGNGLKMQDALPIFEAGTGRNFLTRDATDAVRSYSAWTGGREDFEGLQAIMRKDIGLALSIGAEAGPLPMINALRAVLENVGEETYETWSAIAHAGID